MKLKLCSCVRVFEILSPACCSHLLSHEIQPALQGVGDFNLAIAVVDLHTSGTETYQLEKSNQPEGKQFASLQQSGFREDAHMSGARKLSWSMRTSRLVFTAAL